MVTSNFYRTCKKQGIINLNSKADVARMILVAENMGIVGTEKELIKTLEESKKVFELEEKEKTAKQNKAYIASLRDEEIKHANSICKFSNLIGRDKPIAICNEKLEEIKILKKQCEEQREALLKTGVALYQAGEIKEKDWAIHGGIASGIAGGTAGLATALDIQQKNAEAREHNKQLKASTTSMISGGYWGTYEKEERLKEISTEWWREKGEYQQRLVEMISPIELLEKLNLELVSKNITATGAVELTIRVQPTPDLLIYENVPAVIDGAFYAVLIDGDNVIGNTCFSLPYEGTIAQNELVSYCFDVPEEKANKCEVIFVPENLWAIETKATVAQVQKVKRKTSSTTNDIAFFWAKNIVYGNNISIEKLQRAINVLKEYSNDIKSEKLIEIFEENKMELIYSSAVAVIKGSDVHVDDYEKAIEILKPISSYVNAEQLIESCNQKITELKEQAKIRAKRMKLLAIIGTPLVALLIGLLIVINTVIVPANKYENAISFAEEKQYIEALKLFYELGDYKKSTDYVKEIVNSNEIKNLVNLSYVVKPNGKVLATINNEFGSNNEYGEANVSNWTNIVALSREYGYTVGLKSDGTVVATGKNEYGRCNVSNWRDVVSIYTESNFTVGLKSDGTVVATGDNRYGQCNVSEWNGISSIATNYNRVIGLKSDGSVISTKLIENEYTKDCGQCDVSDWTNIVSVYPEGNFTVGLKSDGTVVATGDNSYGQCNVLDWRDIVSVYTKDYFTIGLKSDGTVVATGNNDEGQCNVSGWKDVIYITGYGSRVLGLKADGTVISTSSYDDFSAWTDIIAISPQAFSTIGLKTDGTVVGEGHFSDEYLKEKGWDNIIAIASGYDFSVGLKIDGTFVTVGDDEEIEKEMKKWNLFE